MSAAGILAPAAVVGIAAFPLYALAIGYGLSAFAKLPPASQSTRMADFLLFAVGLLGTVCATVVHGAMAFAYTHPESHALPPPMWFTLLVGFLPVALCMHAVDRRMERGWPLAATLLLGFILADPAVLFIGRMLHLPATRAW